MSILWTLFEIAINISEATIVFILLKRQLDAKGRKLKIAVCSIALLAACTTIMNLLNFSTTLVTLINALIFVSYSILLFESSITRRIIWGLTPSLIFSFSNYLITTIMMYITPDGTLMLTPSTAVRAEAVLLYAFCNVAILLALFLVKRQRQSIPHLQNIMLIILVVVGIVAVALLFNQSMILAALGEDATLCASASAIP